MQNFDLYSDRLLILIEMCRHFNKREMDGSSLCVKYLAAKVWTLAPYFVLNCMSPELQIVFSHS